MNSLKHIKIKDKKSDEYKPFELKDYHYAFIQWLKNIKDNNIKHPIFKTLRT